MKKIIVCIMAASMSFAFTPTHTMAATKANAAMATSAATNDQARADALVERLKEIKAMDLSELNASEKKVLRTEVLSIKQELKALDGVIYISAGALILIIVLLILLL